MIRHLKASIRLLILATILFGGVYPSLVWVVGHLFFSYEAEGQKVVVQGKVVGLCPVGQIFSSPTYFWSRPSAIPKSSSPILVSYGSNLSWSSPLLRHAVVLRAKALGVNLSAQPLSSVPRSKDVSCPIPEDLIMASASGIDPDISLNAALFQVPRVALARGVTEDELRALVFHHEEMSLFGVFPRRVNVLKLNCALDLHYPLSSQSHSGE